LASKLVYKEGSKFIEALPRSRLAHVALNYIKMEKEITLLCDAVESSNLPDITREEVIQLLEAGGSRTKLNMV
jgi:glutamate dehydrogenase